MPFTVTYDAEADCVMTRISGRLDRRLVTEFFDEVARVASESRCMRMLSDLRRAKVVASNAEIVEELETGRHRSIPRELRRAIVISRDMRDYRFWESACRKRGYLNVRIFADYDEAASWVLEGQALRT